MKQTFSIDLRKRVVDFVEQGNSRRSAAGHFSVSVSFVIDLLRHLKENGSLEPLPCGGTKEGKLAPHHDTILRRVGDVRKARTAWVKRQRFMKKCIHQLVFIDETSVNIKMTRLYGRAPTCERLNASTPFGHWKTETFIAGLRCYGLGCSVGY